jgi:hypothetical protein
MDNVHTSERPDVQSQINLNVVVQDILTTT